MDHQVDTLSTKEMDCVRRASELVAKNASRDTTGFGQASCPIRESWEFKYSLAAIAAVSTIEAGLTA